MKPLERLIKERNGGIEKEGRKILFSGDRANFLNSAVPLVGVKGGGGALTKTSQTDPY